MRRCYFDHCQIANNRRLVRNIFNQQDVDELVEIGLDAACLITIGIDGDGHARNFRFLRPPDCQRVDIEGAASKQGGYTREDAWLVFHVHHKSVHHSRAHSSVAVSTIGLGRRIMSCNEAPAATMG